FVVELQISRAVTWSFNVNSGAANDTYRLTGVPVGSMVFNTGTGREELFLYQPSGKVGISFNGGALTVLVHRPSGTEASVQVSGGAITLTADGDHQRGIGSKSWQTDGYDNATDGYQIWATGGAGSVTVDTLATS